MPSETPTVIHRMKAPIASQKVAGKPPLMSVVTSSPRLNE